MLFNSFEFLLFLCVALFSFFLCPQRFRKYLLLCQSYAFYAFWDYRFCSLLLLSSCVDFWCGKRIEESETRSERRNYLMLSLIVNLGVLGLFKYYNFFAASFGDLAALFGMSFESYTLHIILPVGISFYTFQSLAYSIDVYRNEQKACRNFFDFLLYVSFFPQLVAGPIERAKNLLPQIQNPKTFTWSRFWEGATLITIGYCKKSLISDRIHPIVENAFTNPGRFDAVVLWEGLIAFAVQIYCDFSGYTDIARGIAKWFGIDLRLNFAQPYTATSIRDFWQRWHISLSTFLRDYLYIPLGGNRCSALRRQINVFIVMLLGGLWHGANYTFLLWGFLHSIGIFTHNIWRKSMPASSGVKKLFALKPIAWIFTMLFVLLTWVPFRAMNMESAWEYYQGLFRFPAWHLVQWDRFGFMAFLAFAVYLVDLPERRPDLGINLKNLPIYLRSFVFATLVLILVVIFVFEKEAIPFIYFQF